VSWDRRWLLAGSVDQEMERRLRVVLGVERHVEAGLRQRQAKQFAFAGAVFDQQNGRMRGHASPAQTESVNDSAGIVPGKMEDDASVEKSLITGS
jgi:hypothetical protein